MDDVPRLSSKDVESALVGIYDRRQRDGADSPRHLFAFFGTGVEERLLLSSGNIDVVPVASELELRERLPPLSAIDRRMAFLVPFTADVPMDLAGRFHRDGRVVRIGPETRLRRMFGVAQIERGVSASPLATLLLSSAEDETYPAGVAQLDVSGMWAAWLAKKLDVPTSAGMLEREGLLAWAARDSRGPAFLSEVPEPRRTEVEDALRRHLASLGPDLAAVFQAWRAGRGADALEAGLLFASLAGRGETAARMFVRRLCKDVLRVTSDELIVRVAPALGAAAPGSLRLLERSEHSVRVRAVLDAADARADDPEVRALLGEDPRLPVGWEARRARLAEALEKGVEAREASDVRGATDALRDLESHRTFQEWQGSRLEPAEMAVRLLAWLAGPGVELEEGAASLTDAEGLGRWYAHEGGFVDWARHRARADGDDRLARAIRGVVEAADDLRLALDRRFAAGLRAYVQARRASTQMLPLDRVTERLCKRFLDEREDRRLLVLLIDGMGWAQANELLLDLQDQRVQPIAQPIAWNQTKKGRIGDGNTTWNTVLAGLPTVTEVSRSAFFLGAPIAPGEAGVDASRDDERFRRNKAILHYFAGSETPTLFLRGEVSAQGGQVTQEAVQAVKDPRKRVVGVVLNAIDSSLKADPQRGERWDARAIKPLLPLLEAARDAGRAVLFVSDHGHVRADRFEAGVRKPDAGARWRPWRGDDDRLDDWEMKLDGDGVWAPRGRTSVVMITDDRHRYSTGAHAGEHGGATLAEVVVPCLFLGFREESRGVGEPDDDLTVRPFVPPAFWRFEPREKLARAPRPSAPAQLPLLTQLSAPEMDPPSKPIATRPRTPSTPPRSPTQPPAPPAEVEIDPIAVALESSLVLAALAPTKAQRARVVKAVSVLLRRGSVCSEAVFAAALDEQTRRVPSIVSVLQESLNVDSYPVLVYDRQSRDVRLDRELLIQQFQLPK